MINVGSFVISSNELVSVIARLLYPGIVCKFGMVQRYLSRLCLVCLVSYVLWHATEEVLSMQQNYTKFIKQPGLEIPHNTFWSEGA